MSDWERDGIGRRRFIRTAGAWIGAYVLEESLVGKVAQAWGSEKKIVLPFANGERPLVSYPQKRPLIRLTARPPQLETPFSVFDEGWITPNDAFFVRYHLSGIPTSIDPDTYRISIEGKVNQVLSLSLKDLKTQFEPMEWVAVNQCSGNSRGFFEPRVNGGQLANGAMGNARWKGVSLKDILKKAGLQAGAKQVVLDGLDRPVLPGTPDFVKALEIDHANDGEVMLAYSMNGTDLPFLNGYPVRVIVPGYYGTYWVKHLSSVRVVDQEFDGFWMKTAYRVPDNSCACIEPGTAPQKTRPIGRLNIRSFITNLHDGAVIKAGQATLVRGIAFDGGSGIREVALSVDGGKTWQPTQLGEDRGKFSFREWQTSLQMKSKGQNDLRVRATNRLGETQPLEPRWNSVGYMRNVVESVKVECV